MEMVAFGNRYWNDDFANLTVNVLLRDFDNRKILVSDLPSGINTVYVHPNGDDNDARPGDPTRPYGTFASALAECPSTNGAVVSLGGEFTEDINIGARTNFTLSIRNTKINGSITSPSQAFNCFIEAEGSLVTNSTSTVFAINGSDVRVTGGRFIATGNNVAITALNGVKLSNCYFESDTQVCASGIKDSIVRDCIFIAASDFAFTGSNSYVRGCYIERTDGGTSIRTDNDQCVYSNCSIKGAVESAVNVNTTGRFEKCRIESTTSHCVNLVTDPEVYFYNCILIGATDCVRTVSINNSATSQCRFVNCEMYALSGSIFLEPTSNSITGKKIYTINCIYNDNFTPNTTGEQRVFEIGKQEITDLTVPPALTL